jgi:hypothetical protein
VAREKLTRPEQRFNYALAIGAVALVVVLVIVSPHVQLEGVDLPILVVALLAGAFLFGLGQIILGITRRRRYLRSLDAGDGPPTP